MVWRESATVEHAWRWLAKKKAPKHLGALVGQGKATHLV